MRRELLTQSSFLRGFSDSVNPLLTAPDSWAAGSSNISLAGEGIVRPFAGLTSYGAGSGANYMTQLGANFGGLQNYSVVTGQGSLLETYSQTVFAIGSGHASKLGTPLQSTSLGSFTFVAADVNTTTGAITEVAHGLLTGQPVYVTTTSSMPLGLTTTTPYWVVKIDADTFKVASSYKNSLVPTPITGGTDGAASTMTLHYGDDVVVLPLLHVLSDQVATYFYTYLDEAGLDQAEAPTVAVPTIPTAPYVGQVNGAVNFKIAAIRDRQNVGQNIDNPNAPVKGRASSATAVVVPNNKTVQITFPTAQTGQTHWAVFSTYEGFGGTGDFYRLGYRTSSDTDATWYFGISETTISGATGRTLEFDYRTGDLLPEEAWLEDYPPPAGTHCIRLENVMIVFGCYDGTVAAVSLPNFFESYNPFHLLYFPEAVTAVLHRPVDDYAYVACRNSIHAVQYVGYRDEQLPAATITTVSSDIGVAYQQNWAVGGGQICIFVEGTGLVMMTSQGEIDFEFGKEVNAFTSAWTASGTSVAFDPYTRSFVCGNGTSAVSYCLETGTWSSPIYTADAGITGTWVMGINSGGRLIVTLTNSGTQTAYLWDDNTNTTRMQTSAISQWQSAPVGRSARIFEGDLALTQGANVEPIVIGIHTNLFTTHARECAVTASSNVLTVPTGTFANNGTLTGKQFAVFGTGIGNVTWTSGSVSTVNDTITFTGHNFVTGQSITVTTGGTLPSPIVVSTTYYIIVVDTNTIQLATTLTNAYAGTQIDLTTTGSGTSTAVVNFLVGVPTYASTTTVTMANRNTGGSLTAGSSASGLLALFAHDFFVRSPYANIRQHQLNFRPQIMDARSWCFSAVMPTDAITGQILTGSISGTSSSSSLVNIV